MGLVRRLPGRDCRFFQRGRCLYEERLNPGYHAGWRCRVLARWEAAYEDFLRQADAFGLEEASASGLWRQRFERLAAGDPQCLQFQPSREGDLPGCVFVLEGLCLLTLPDCAGLCPRFQSSRCAPSGAEAKE